MKETLEFNFPKDIYDKYLSSINEIKFTQRQMDIIAFICNGRSGKKTAAFFSISPKTVEYHTNVIMTKLRCSSRESIIDFVEKSGKFPWVNDYYMKILVHEKGEGVGYASEAQTQLTQEINTLTNRKVLKRHRYTVGPFLLCLAIVEICFLHYNAFNQPLHSGNSGTSSTRSDFVIPIDSILLDRTSLISQIESQFKKYPERIQTIALTGIGGSGKTTLARQYARQQKASVVWEINAETKGSISVSFENLAYVLSKTEEERKTLKALLEIKDSTERERKIIQWVKGRLKISKTWILIYDNIENFNQIQKYFPSDPETWGSGQIIVTTRDNHIQNNNLIDALFQIGELRSDQKLQLFEKIMNQSVSHSVNYSQRIDMKKFLKEIPSFPLDVVIAAYYLKTTGTPTEKYLDLLKNSSKYFENIQRNMLKEMGEYTKTRYSIIALSIDKLVKENRDFRDLLLLVSLLDSQDIPLDLLKTVKSDVIVDDFIFHLKKYFLIINHSPSDSGSRFSIHRSTQALSLAYLINTLNLEKEDTLTKPITETLIKYISTTMDGHDFQSMKTLVTHCETFLTHQNILNDFMIGNIQGELGGLYFYLGRYANSISNLEESLVKLNRGSTKNHKEVARSLRHLGNFYRDLGDYNKSKNLFEQSHVIYEKHISSDHAGIARSYTYLGLIYRNLGQYEKAREHLIKSLNIYEKYVTEPKSKKLGIARALAYLGSIERILGYYDNAGKHEEESLIIFKEYFPDNHLKVGWVLSYLGHFYREIKNYDKAKECLEKSYSIYTKYFSVNHLKVAWVSLLLGNLYHEMGDSKKAMIFLKQCLAVYEREYGKDHIETAKVFRNLGQAYALEGNFELADQFIQSALAIFTKHNHSECYITLESIADLYLKESSRLANKGDKKKATMFKSQAIDCLNQAMKSVESHFTKNSIHKMRLENKVKGL